MNPNQNPYPSQQQGQSQPGIQPPQPDDQTIITQQSQPTTSVSPTDHFGGPHPDAQSIVQQDAHPSTTLSESITAAPQTSPPQPQAIPQPQSAYSGAQPAPTGGSTQPYGEAAPPQPPAAQQPKRGKRIGAIIAILVAVGLVVVAGVYGYRLLTTASLQTYEADGYTIDVPVGYTEESFGDFVSFRPDDETSSTEVEWGSSIAVSKSEVSAEFAEQITATVREMALGEDGAQNFAATLPFTPEVTDYTTREGSIGGYDAIFMSAQVLRDGEKVGTTQWALVFAPTAYYSVSVDATVDNHSLERSASRIIDSFTIIDG